MCSFHTLLALTLLILEASATSVCSKIPYALFTPLSKHAAAQTFCTKKYPIPQPTCFVTTTIPTTATFFATTSVAPVTFTKTVTIGEPSSTSVTDTITPIPITVTTTIQTGVTITTCPPTFTKRTYPKTTDKLAPIFSSLQKQASSFVKTLCSCIETTPGCSTKTITARPTASTTRTTTVEVTPTSTVVTQNTAVVTIYTTVTLAPVEVTVTATATSTSTFCPAPTQPICNPAKCSADFFCAPNQSCVCLISIEGVVGCGDTNAIISNCADTIPCQTSADCVEDDQLCVTNLCCNNSQCITVKKDTCPNGLAASRLFKTGNAGSGGAPSGGNFPKKV